MQRYGVNSCSAVSSRQVTIVERGSLILPFHCPPFRPCFIPCRRSPAAACGLCTGSGVDSAVGGGAAEPPAPSDTLNVSGRTGRQTARIAQLRRSPPPPPPPPRPRPCAALQGHPPPPHPPAYPAGSAAAASRTRSPVLTYGYGCVGCVLSTHPF